MTRQVIRVGDQLKDGKGESIRTALVKCNANFSELTSFLSGGDPDSLGTALPITRGGTGASTIAGIRNNLGLGDTATLSTGLDEGNVFLVGTYGIGTDLSPAVTLVEQKTATDYKSGEFGYFIVDGISTITLGTRDSNVKGQIGMSDIDGFPFLSIRGADTTFSPWYKQFGSNNVIVTAKGDLKYSENSIEVHTASVVSQHGTEHTLGNTEVGSYSITNATLDTSQWTLIAPDGYEATVAQSGSGLELRVTKDGEAINIPNNQYFTIHLSK